MASRNFAGASKFSTDSTPEEKSGSLPSPVLTAAQPMQQQPTPANTDAPPAPNPAPNPAAQPDQPATQAAPSRKP